MLLMTITAVLVFCACKKSDEAQTPASASTDFRDAVIGNYQCSCYSKKTTVRAVYINDSTEESETIDELRSSSTVSLVEKINDPLSGNIRISNPKISIFLNEQYLSGSASIPSNRGPFAGASFIGDSMYCDYMINSGWHPKGYGTTDQSLFKCKKNK